MKKYNQNIERADNAHLRLITNLQTVCRLIRKLIPPDEDLMKEPLLDPVFGKKADRTSEAPAIKSSLLLDAFKELFNLAELGLESRFL